jgi:hypothetical protein
MANTYSISSDAIIKVNLLEDSSNFWPSRRKQLQLCLHFIQNKDKCTTYKFEECDAGLCTIMCFRDYQTQTTVKMLGLYLDVGQP